MAAFGVAGLVSAKSGVISSESSFTANSIEYSNSEKDRDVIILVRIDSDVSRTLTFQWTSTCGTTYQTSFSGGWSIQQMAQYISDYNLDTCGVRPSNVIIGISEEML